MAHSPRQILAISNSAALFVEAGETPHLANYLIGMTKRKNPVICLVAAANGESSENISRFFALAQRAGFEARHLNFFALDEGDPDRLFAGVDALYLDGGSTRNLRAILREWKADEALKRSYKSGVIVSGASAGANILFEWGMTDSVRSRIEPTRGIGLLRGSLSVHANVRQDRNEALHRHLNGANASYPAFALDDCTALHFSDDELCRALSTKARAKVCCDTGDGTMDRLPSIRLVDGNAVEIN